MIFNVDDCRATYEELLGKGVDTGVVVLREVVAGVGTAVAGDGDGDVDLAGTRSTS